MLVYIVMFALMLVNSLYSIHTTRQKLYDRLYDALYLQNKQVQDSLTQTERYFANYATDAPNLTVAEQQNDGTSYYSAVSRLQQELSNTLQTMPLIRGMFIFPTTSQLFIASSDDAILANKIKGIISSAYQEGQIDALRNNGWFTVEVDGQIQLLRVLRVRNSYLGAWTDLSRLLPSVKNEQTLEQTALFLLDGGETVLEETSRPSEIELGSPSGPDDRYAMVRLDERYMLVKVDAGYVPGGQVALLVPDRLITDELKTSYALVVVIATLLLGLAMVVIFVLQRYLQRPIAQLKDSIDALRGGDFSTRVEEEYACEEFAEVDDAFNDMVERIEGLKISVYEEKLSQQRTEMRFLKSQIAPHFLINCLNAIYHMAGTGDTAKIKSMTVRLGDHLRYALADLSFVPLHVEVTEASNYIELARLRFADSVKIYTELDPQAAEALVLPMMVLHFVENTVKHEVVSGKLTEIHVEARMKEKNGVPRVLLTLWDTGSGWPEKYLQLFNSGGMLRQEDGHHVGISNVYQRMKIQFGEDFTIHFTNHPGAGAQVEFDFPYTLPGPAQGEEQA